MAESSLAGEVARLRQRAHANQAEHTAMLLRIVSLEAWRIDHQQEADKAFEKLHALAQESVTAFAVAAALKDRNRLELSWTQRVAGIILFGLTLADFLARYLGH